MLTETADIESAVESGNEGKIISTTHWGNLLIWKDEQVLLEISRKDGSNCHEGQINQLIAGEGELITIGTYVCSS